MSDPFETLTHLDEVPVDPTLPAAEVRRRGDRMRRRRTAVRALGAACAVAVITTGGIALGGNLTGAAPPPVTTQGPSPLPSEPPTDGGSPRTQQALSIPDGFPLLEGLPAEDVDTERKAEQNLGTARIFDPCHNNADAAVETGRTDYRNVTQSGPAYTYLREIVVYESSSAADEAMLLAKGELERCPQYLYDDGISRDLWEPAPASERTIKADDFILEVNHGYSDYGITTLATSWVVVRVGNAIVSLALDGEFGASKGSTRDVVDGELDVYDAIAPSMCLFADETTDIGCSEPSTAPGPGEVTDPGPDFLLDEATLREVTGVDEFETTPDSQTATLACQGDWLSSLLPDTADYRQFEARGKDGRLGAWAGTAVLGFPDQEAARAAYDTVTGDWLADCDPQVDTSHRLVTAVDSGLGPMLGGTVLTSPYAWRGVLLTRPERCVECDAAWDDHEGAVLVGSRVVLLHVAYGGDMQFGVDDSRSPMDELLPLLARRTPRAGSGAPGQQATTRLGPDGYGPLRLGMTAAEAEATGTVTLEDSHGQGCTTFALVDPAGQGSPGMGYVSPGKGVVAIFVDRGVETPEGIHVGSGITEVKRAYADLSGSDGSLTAPASDTARYVMTFDHNRLEELALANTHQDCFG
jgi:hypothetical protein